MSPPFPSLFTHYSRVAYSFIDPPPWHSPEAETRHSIGLKTLYPSLRGNTGLGVAGWNLGKEEPFGSGLGMGASSVDFSMMDKEWFLPAPRCNEVHQTLLYCIQNF